MNRTAAWTIAAFAAAALGAQDAKPSAEERFRELERQNREIVDRLKASEDRNAELESKLGALASERRLEAADVAIETQINALNTRFDEAVNWKQLTRSGNPIKFYGFFRTDFQYSTARFNDNVNILTVRREGDGTGGTALRDDDEFGTSVRLTRFGFDVNAGRVGSADITGKLEIDFANTPVKSVLVSGTDSDADGQLNSVSTLVGSDESRQTPRIRLAYSQVDFGEIALRFGQDWDIIAPLLPSVNSDTLLWNAGNLGERRPSAQFIWDTGDPKATSYQFKLAAGLSGAIDAADVDRNGQKDGWDAGHPHLQSRFGVSTPSWVGGKMVGIGVWGYVARNETDTAAFAGDNHFTAWTLGTDFSVPLCGGFTLRGEAFVGEALGDVRGSIGQSFGPLREISTYGGWSEIEWKIDSLTFAAGGSIDNPDDADLSFTGTNPGASKNWTLYFAGNYDFGGGFKVGSEVIYWETQYGTAGLGNAVRLNVYTVFTF